ncbi:hypothetical protein FJZ28_01725 [Candidatus Peregrinibacteria bacterium]|nr:hypothetical protein [Candidatus Peregrinibacteria bacterium]
MTHTTDIIDLVILDPVHACVMDKAYYDNAAARPGTGVRKLDEGRLAVEDEGEGKRFRYRPADTAGEPHDLFNIPHSDASLFCSGGLAARYEVRGNPKIVYQLELEEGYRIRRFASMLGEHVESDTPARWQALRPLTGIEIKKAGSARGVQRIKRQLARQRSAVLRHRDERPDSISGMIDHIDVVVLNPNRELHAAVRALNEEGPAFFNYVEFSSIGTEFRRAQERLQNRTLPEVQVLKRFFHRVNDEISASPTLLPLPEQDDQRRDPGSDLAGAFRAAGEEGTVVVEEIRDYLRKEEDYRTRQQVAEARAARLQRARDLLREFEEYLGSTTCDKTAGERLEAVLERDLGAMFTRHFSTPYHAPASGRNRLTVHEERDGKLQAYPRRFQVLSHAMIGGVDLLERARSLAQEHGIAIDCTDLESLQEFIEYLTGEVERREAAQSGREALERTFRVRTIECQIGGYEEIRDERFGERFISYTPLETGPITGIRRDLAGQDVNMERVSAEELLLAFRVRQALANPEGSPANKSIAAAASIAFHERTECSPHFEQGEQLTRKLHALFMEMIGALETTEDGAVGGLLTQWRQTLGHIGHEHAGPLDQSWTACTLPIVAREFEGRHCLELNLMPHIERALAARGFTTETLEEAHRRLPQELRNGTTFNGDPAEAQQIHSLVWHQLAIGNRRHTGVPGAQEDAPAAAMPAIPGALTAMAEAIAEAMGKAVQSSQKNVNAAAMTKITLAEQRVLFEFGLRMLESAVALHNASPRLARDYALTSIQTFVRYPEIYSDLYLDKYLRINDALATADAAHVRRYLAFAAEREHTAPETAQGEFLRRLVVLSLQEHLPVPSLNPPLCPGVTRVFELIRLGGCADEDAARDAHFAEAHALCADASAPTQDLLLPIYRMERDDPHIRWIRRSGRGLRRGNRESASAFDDLHETLEKFHSQLDEAVDVLTASNYAAWEERKRRNDPEIRRQMGNILAAFTELAGRFRRACPELVLDASDMFRPEIYRGFRCHGRAVQALAHLRQHAPEWEIIYRRTPDEIAAHAYYLDPDRKEKLQRDKKRWHAGPPPKQGRENPEPLLVDKNS